VFALALLLNFGIRALDSQVKNDGSGLHTYTGIIDTTGSGVFLYLIALLNLVVLLSIVKVFKEMRTGRYSDEELERQLDSRGLMSRVFGERGDPRDHLAALRKAAAATEPAAVTAPMAR
jgi:nickel/cobalt transporter (NiCoT) family protein